MTATLLNVFIRLQQITACGVQPDADRHRPAARHFLSAKTQWLWNEAISAQAIKQPEERIICGLILEKAEFPAFRHVRDDLYRPSEIGIRMPWRRET